MKLLTALLVFFLLGGGIEAQTYRYRKIIGDTATSNSVTSIDPTFDGGFIVGGSRDDGAVSSSYVIKTDALGNPQWSRDYFYSYINAINDIIQTSDSGYLFTGYAPNASQWNDIQLVKLDALGNIQWSFTYSNRVDPNVTGCGGLGVVESANYYYITGGFGRIGSAGAMILKVDLSGNLVTSNLIFTPISGVYGYFGICDIRILPNGNFVTALSWNAEKVLVYTFDADCNILNHFTVRDPVSVGIAPLSIQQNISGNYLLVCNNLDTTATRNLLFMEINSSGTILSSYRYDFPGFYLMRPYASVDNAGNVIISGGLRTPPANADSMFVLRLTIPGGSIDKIMFRDEVCTGGRAVQLYDGSYAIASSFYGTSGKSGITKLDRNLTSSCAGEDFAVITTPHNVVIGPGGLIATETIVRYQFFTPGNTLATSNTILCSDSTFENAPLDPFSDHYVWFPNAFTPSNADGTNDQFIPVYGEFISEYSLLIFNRWGQLIFESDSPLIGWDGTFKNTRCMNDVYVWKADFTIAGEKRQMIGHVTLL